MMDYARGALGLDRRETETAGGSGAAEGAPPAHAQQLRYKIETFTTPETIRNRLEMLAPACSGSPFQHPRWIAKWYATLGREPGVEPLLVSVSLDGGGTHVLDAPLIRRATGALRTIAFADLGVTDYNAPVLGPAAPVTTAQARLMWREVCGALPRADVIHLTKMPLYPGERINPLALLGAESVDDKGFSVSVPEEWESYIRSLSRKFRKELGRSGRLFEKAGKASFRRIADPEEAKRTLRVLETQQRTRLTALGYSYVLDRGGYSAFYESVLLDGIERGFAVLTVLEVDGEIIAALLGIIDSGTYSMIRITHAGGAWEKIGPGRLIIERTMRMLNRQGVRHFDFGVGDLPYKHGFQVQSNSLYDYYKILSWKGAPSIALLRMKAQSKRLLARADLYRRYRRRADAYYAARPGKSRFFLFGRSKVSD